MVLSLTAWNAFRLVSSILDWDVLTEFAPRPGPIYIAITASFWTLGGLALFRLILRRSRRAPLLMALFFAGYICWWWTDRLLLQSPRPNAAFALAASLLIMADILVLTFNRKTREYFQTRETHEQTPTDPDPA